MFYCEVKLTETVEHSWPDCPPSSSWTERSSGGDSGWDQEPLRQHAGRLPEAGGGSGGAAGPAEVRPGEPEGPVRGAAGHQDQTGAGDRRVQEAAGGRDWEVNGGNTSVTLSYMLDKYPQTIFNQSPSFLHDYYVWLTFCGKEQSGGQTDISIHRATSQFVTRSASVEMSPKKKIQFNT